MKSMHRLWSRTTFGGISERVRCQIEAYNMRMKTQWVKRQWDKWTEFKMENNFIHWKNRAWFPCKTERIDDKNAQKTRKTTANVWNHVLFPFRVGRDTQQQETQAEQQAFSLLEAAPPRRHSGCRGGRDCRQLISTTQWIIKLLLNKNKLFYWHFLAFSSLFWTFGWHRSHLFDVEFMQLTIIRRYFEYFVENAI